MRRLLSNHNTLLFTAKIVAAQLRNFSTFLIHQSQGGLGVGYRWRAGSTFIQNKRCHTKKALEFGIWNFVFSTQGGRGTAILYMHLIFAIFALPMIAPK